MNGFFISTALQLVNIILLISWIVIAIIAVISLRKKKLHATPKALWTLIILCVPILGAIAFLIIQPEDV